MREILYFMSGDEDVIQELEHPETLLWWPSRDPNEKDLERTEKLCKVLDIPLPLWYYRFCKEVDGGGN